MRYFIACLILLMAGAEARAQAASSDQPVGEGPASSSFAERIDGVFRAEAGEPLDRASKRPPLRPGRAEYTRGYSFSIVRFAARCFYLNEQIDEANAALVENAQHYLDHPKGIIDRDSFHWHADIVMRLIDMYGTNGSAHAGLLTPETEAICLEPIWIYVKHSAIYNKPDHLTTQAWDFLSTENHHAMDFTTQWHFARLAKDRPEYADQRLDGDVTLAELYRAWGDYMVVYARERAKKGTNIEIMCPGYNSVWLKGIYNFRDFGEPEVRKSAEMLIDLYWAYWAQEQLNGIAGGGKTRIRGIKGFSGERHGIPTLGWLYFGVGRVPTIFMGELNAMLSDYEPPAIVAEIARSGLDDGPYEIRQRAQGLGQQGVSDAILKENSRPNVFRTDGGGIVRYSYCDPAFIMGTLMHEPRPREDWVAISSQSRWQGVIFADAPGARIVPAVRPAGSGRDVLNGQWSVQSKGSLIVHKLEGNHRGGPMIVWISKEGIGEPVREQQWVFAETSGAYAAIRVVGSGFKMSDGAVSNPSLTGADRKAPPGTFVMADDDFSPVIVEVMSKRDMSSFDEFKSLVKSRQIRKAGSVIGYETIYGDRLTLDTSYEQMPTINGEPVDYAPPNVHESPFVNSVYDSGVVTISKGERERVLDFNARSSR
ncbi:MAG: hypothetical protein AAF078_05365 [Planctomycetota bacterium]